MFIDSTPRAAAAAALGLLCTGAAICASQETPPAVQTPPAYHQVTDEIGRTIRVPQNIHRIVSLAPNLTETVYALGLQDRLVGDTDYCDFPPEAQLKAKVGGAINPSLEAIAALHPDLVLVTKNLNRLETVQALAGIGIPSYATDPHTVEAIIASTERLADLLVAPDEVAFDAGVFLLRKDYAKILKKGAPVHSVPEPTPQPHPDPSPEPRPPPAAEPAATTTTLRLVGMVPPEVWNRLGTKILPKLRSGSDLRIGLEFTVTVKSDTAASLGADLQQILQELGLSDAVRVE